MSNPDETRLVSLIRQLAEATLDGRLEWEATDRAATFICTRPQGAARIESVDRDGSPPFEFTLLDPDGVVVERVRENPVQAAMWDEPLSQLYFAARSSALNISQVLNAWFDDLEPF